MKKLLENFKKNMDERFRGPTDDPSFSDPGHDEPEGYAEFADKVSDIIDAVTNGQEFKLPNGQTLSYNDFGDGDGQYILDGDVFANSFDEAEEELIDMLDMESLNEQKIKDLVKQKILENLGAGESNLAQQRLKGAAGAAQKKLENPAVDRAIGLATKRLQKAPPQQKVDFLLKKIGYTASKTGLAEDSSLSGTKKAPFAEAVPSPLVIASTCLWADSTYIPATPPGSDSDYVKVYL